MAGKPMAQTQDEKVRDWFFHATKNQVSDMVVLLMRTREREHLDGAELIAELELLCKRVQVDIDRQWAEYKKQRGASR